MSSWLVSSKPSYFDAVEAFKENEFVDWGNGSNNKIEVGDIVYIYITENIKEIKIKAQVTKTNLTYDEIYNNDEKFYKGEEENRLNNPANNFFRLQRLKIYSNEISRKLSLEILRTKGLKNVQGKTRISEELIKYIYQLENNKIENINEDKAMNIKNIILYGAPGVGKTHNYTKLIAMIEEGKTQKDIFASISENKEVTQDSQAFKIAKDEKRVEFVTFHQSYSYEDFIEGFRPNDDGKIERKDGIFKIISDRAKKNLENSTKQIDTIKEEKKFEELFELFKDFIEDEISKNKRFDINETAYITNIEENAFRYQGDNWGNTQRMKFSDIELLYNLNIFERKEIKKVENISGLAKQHATYFSYFMKHFLKFKGEQNIDITNVEKEEEKNYYIVIDEINRGNISKIFGELITLIEEDKRDTYEVTLPYSKEKFKIPSNLYIIATMNSTDKSIATLDIALRRRFTFLKMQPKPELVKDIDAQELMKKLNEHISDALGDDYKLGHSYFMKVLDAQDLEFVKEYKIKPLLEEYFYADDEGYKKAVDILINKQDKVSDGN
jgi:5-methylcytosine-specific restriction protein B